MPNFFGRTCFLASFLRKVGFELLRFKSRGLPLLLQRFLNSHSHGNGHAAMGEQCGALRRSNASNLPVAGCHFTHGRKRRSGFLLLQRFLNCNSHTDSSADHGVVAHAQEAHHFHVKSACRRLCACGARLFRAANTTFHKSGNTSLIPIECAFLTGCIISHLLFTKQGLLTKLNTFFHLLSFSIIFYHLCIILSLRGGKANQK